ncbi:MAG: hypothetical protein AABM67_20865 [Acidobacteriota bacterium]
MSKPKEILASFTNYLAFAILVVLSATLTSAQTPGGSANPSTGEVTNRPEVTVPINAAAEKKSDAIAAKTPAGLVAADVALMNAKTEEAKREPASTPPATPCQRNIYADVVAMPQAIMLNRMGAAIPDGLIFALRKDTVIINYQGQNYFQLRKGKRPRPLVLRANVGDCLEIKFTNGIPPQKFGPPLVPNVTRASAGIGTQEVSLHIQGMEWATGPGDDGSFVGRNESSLASATPRPSPMPPGTQVYKVRAKAEGTFLLYSMGDTSTQGMQLERGLFGALNVQPKNAEWYRSQVTADDLLRATYNANKVPPGSLSCPKSTAYPVKCTFKVYGKKIAVLKTPGGYLNTLDNHPLINYESTYSDGHPILKMLDKYNNIVHSDLTAIITGPYAGRFPGAPDPPCNPATVNPSLCRNPASPDRKQPYREVTIIYHEAMDPVTAQAFPVFDKGDPLHNTIDAGKDAFSINYGTAGIAPEVYANRIGVGPMGNCVDCKFEEFFLSSWSVGDPAMLVDTPANSNNLTQTAGLEPPCKTVADFTHPPCAGTKTLIPGDPYNDAYTMTPTMKAQTAFFPDDPSNVYHSYINDHIKFRILHGGTGVSHVHHQHAHQWLQSPNSDEGSYLDSQMISPGSSYTLEMVYNGSGNRNKVVGDSIFHCHFYPHFASGMWSMWRTHDTFESGTFVFRTGPKAGQVVPGSRALPDGEIIAGTPTPALVPIPTIPMAPLPAYAQIRTNVTVHGAATTFGGQVVIGGTCQPGNRINGLTVIGGCLAGQQLNGTVINSQFNGVQMTGQFRKSLGNVIENPGYPYFIPGIAGSRPTHPPLDFAPNPSGGFLDGGLPRHLVAGGSISYERHDQFDWSKDLATANAVKLPEEGTKVEQAAMAFFGKRCYPTFLPDGTAGLCPSSNSTPPQSTLVNPPTGFVLNGLPRKNPGGNSAEQLGAQPGAPFADPAIDDNGIAVGLKRTYKAAAIQLNVVYNKKELGWHYPQHRMLTLWKDVEPTLDFSFGKPGRPPEPLFFRGNTGDIIEYWHTNLVPNYYLVDDFQVRTPTDILGQHIHLVKFDVTSSDGAGNGFNYEDGTFSPQEVQEMITAINRSANRGFMNAPNQPLEATTPPKEIFDCYAYPDDPRCRPCPHDAKGSYSRPPCHSWVGAQTTIQRWYIDPLVDNADVDRTMRTVFTHDHFGPSTHQQAGLYAGLLIEPKASVWRNSEDGSVMGRPLPQPPIRSDGGPTSWKADIVTEDKSLSYREFALEFQDFQLAYQVNQIGGTPAKYPSATSIPSDVPSEGFRDKTYALGAPDSPTLISTLTVGTQSVNYLNEPLPWRAQIVNPGTGFDFGDLSNAFDSDIPQTDLGGGLKTPLLVGDPITPRLRAYQGDRVQVRVLVGAHMFAHQFNLNGPTWFSEPAWKDSGYRSTQAMGLSEHFEFLFNVPSSSAPGTGRKCPDKMSDGGCVDYLYSPSFDEMGLASGLWGLFRSYDPNKTATNLMPLPNNPVGAGTSVTYATCPAGAPKRTYNITAVTAQKALALRSPVPGDPTKGQIVFNDRDGGDPNNRLRAKLGIMYVRNEDLDPQGRLKPGVPIEPLVLRANAGDCIDVWLTNGIENNSDLFSQTDFYSYQFPLGDKTSVAPTYFEPRASKLVGMHPQLLSYDALTSTGYNVGFNRKMTNGQTQIAKFGDTRGYRWYAGKVERKSDGSLDHKPVEFGSLNLFPSDPLFQNMNALFGQMIIEPQGSTWQCGESGNVSDCYPAAADPPPTTRTSATVTLSDQSKFREFSVMISDALKISQNNTSAVNYRTEPQSFRYLGNPTTDFSCMLSNLLWHAPTNPVSPIGEPRTPIFTANPGDQVRFRMTHPFGTGTSQVFTVHGHAWQRNPYTSESTVIGNNNLSQWLGSRDNHGSTDHFELVLDKAGGEGYKTGDYLYSVYLPQQARLGAWGLFRVGPRGPNPAPNFTCDNPASGPTPAVTQQQKDQFNGFIRQPTSKKAKDPQQ